MSKSPDTIIVECSHCGNLTPHQKIHEYTHSKFFEDLGNGQKITENFTWLSYACKTCGGLNLYGDFFSVYGYNELMKAKLHPKGSGLLPPSHMLSPSKPVPDRILRLYEEVWPLRHKSPPAFVGQVRRLLEYICHDQKASGKDLFKKLEDLVTKGVFPGYFREITDLLRIVGNMGSHATEDDLDVWDAELIDDFFRSVIDYVYISPAKIKRMQERIKIKPNN